MGGIECLQAFNAWRAASARHGLNDEMLVIGMSATASHLEQQLALDTYMHFFSPKPVDMGLLKEALRCKTESADLTACIDAISLAVVDDGFWDDCRVPLSISPAVSSSALLNASNKSTSVSSITSTASTTSSMFSRWLRFSRPKIHVI